jgi:hypothetical protein
MAWFAARIDTRFDSELDAFLFLLDGDAGISLKGVRQSVRAGVLHPLASSVDSASQGAASTKTVGRMLGPRRQWQHARLDCTRPAFEVAVWVAGQSA